MPEMISKIAHEYAGRLLNAGDRFDADPQFVHLLKVLGRAEEALPVVPQSVENHEPVAVPARAPVRNGRRGKARSAA